MKLRKRKTSKILVIIGIAILAVALFIGVISIVNSSIQAKKGKEISDITISRKPYKYEYYVGEEFDPTGTIIQVRTYDMNNTYFVDYSQLRFSGFDSSAVNDSVVITVSYKGYKTTFTVRVFEPKPPKPTLETIELVGLNTVYSLSEWNLFGLDTSGVMLNLIYSDGSVVTDIALRDKYVFGYTKLETAGKTEVVIKYSDGEKVIELPVTITITN